MAKRATAAKPGAGKQPRSKRDFEKFARKHGGNLHEGKNHTLVTGPKAGRPVPLKRHAGDYEPWYCRNLFDQLKLIGVCAIGCFIPICLIIWLINGLASMY